MFWGFNHLPLIDFRPFKVGANIQKGIRSPVCREMTFIYNVNE
jgi:hypothetical protein